jgi:hypothetical protein
MIFNRQGDFGLTTKAHKVQFTKEHEDVLFDRQGGDVLTTKAHKVQVHKGTQRENSYLMANVLL